MKVTHRPPHAGARYGGRAFLTENTVAHLRSTPNSPHDSGGHGGESAWLSGWRCGGIGERREVGEGRGAADSADWWEMISSNFTCNTPEDRGLRVGGGDKEGEQRLRWTFLGERRGCNTRRRLGVKPAGEDKRQPLRIEAAPEGKKKKNRTVSSRIALLAFTHNFFMRTSSLIISTLH